MKNSSDTIENRTRDFPACSAVPQSTAPPRPPLLNAYKNKFTNFSSVIHKQSMLCLLLLQNRKKIGGSRYA